MNAQRAAGIGFLALTSLFTAACGLRIYPPASFTGTVVNGVCEPSELGSGDRYNVTLRDEAGAEKTLRYSWPEATHMCYERAAMPNIGDLWTVKTTNPYVDPGEGVYYMPAWAEVTARQARP